MMLREPGRLTFLERIQMIPEVWRLEDPVADRRSFIGIAAAVACANRDLFHDEITFGFETLHVDNGEHHYSYK